MFDFQTITDIFAGQDETQSEKLAADLITQGEFVLSVLSSWQTHPDPNVRWWLLRTISGISHPDTSQWLVQGLSDPDLAVRQCAALGLRSHPTREAIPGLIESMSHPDGILARLAVDALVAIGEAAVEPLVTILASKDKGRRANAARALAEIGDERAIPLFFECLQNGDAPLVVHWAEVGLQRMGIGMAFFKP